MHTIVNLNASQTSSGPIQATVYKSANLQSNLEFHEKWIGFNIFPFFYGPGNNGWMEMR